MPLPKKLQHKLNKRKANNAFRSIGVSNTLIDFTSNDYLGLSTSKTIFQEAHQLLLDQNFLSNGATGSRLLSGNHSLYNTVETLLSEKHHSEASLIFNSGYNANLGVFSCVPQRNDIILYDELCHASIRDGLLMSNAKAYKFKHNNLEHLEQLLLLFTHPNAEVYVVTESVFSMDGDSPNLKGLVGLCAIKKAHLVIDEAHALGVFGYGLVQQLHLESQVFARIMTFGKALGCHGAAVLGCRDLIDYLINFCRSFIYTTALPPHSIATIAIAYKHLDRGKQNRTLSQRIDFFKRKLKQLKLQTKFINSHSAIHCCVIPNNTTVKMVSQQLEDKGFSVKPILSPTVPKGQERLRFCLHSYNSEAEISEVLQALATFVS